jgi:hypothetical protein
MLSSTLRANKDSGLGKILNAKFTNHPRSQEWQEAGAQLNRIDETMRKRTPSERHNRRKSALYVEPLSETNWNRPASTLKSEARDFLMDAVNDYAGPHERFQPGSPILMATDPELYQALQGWPDRPALPATEWPMAS